jgi:hypothetical protein
MIIKVDIILSKLKIVPKANFLLFAKNFQSSEQISGKLDSDWSLLLQAVAEQVV